MRMMAMRLAGMAIAVAAVSGCMQTTSAENETPAYSVASAENEFEIRNYRARSVAQYSARGNYGKAVQEGYIKLERYFLGENVVPEAIPITGPVMVRDDGSAGWTTTFLLPVEMSVENAPAPIDQRVRVIELPERRVAAIRFPGEPSEAAMREQASKLDFWLASRDIAHKGDFTMTGNTAPWLPSAWRENEVVVTLN